MNGSRHGGNLREIAESAGIPAEGILDFSANLNPLGPPAWVRSAVSRALDRIEPYPDPDCTSLVLKFSEKRGVSPDQVMAGNGSSELIYLLPRALPARRVVVPAPAYVDYAEAARVAGLPVEHLISSEADDFRIDLDRLDRVISPGDLIFIGQPSNPAGQVTEARAIRELAATRGEAFFVIDEAFADFVEDMDSLVRDRPPNVAVLLSFTKIFAIAGIRLGFVVAEREIIRSMTAIKPPWTVNTLAAAVGEVALSDEEYVERTRRITRTLRQQLRDAMSAFGGITVIEGKANYLLCRIDREGMDASDLARRLLSKGVAIRVCANFRGLDPRYFRVAVRSEKDNRTLVEAMREVLDVHPPLALPRRTPALMFQGLTSSAGKSVLSAAFCRILLQDGYNVFPFKCQNMALNSFVTADGKEMGRAQVVQAQACRKDPDVRMNPVLLKPNSDTGCQVIVMGRPVGNMNVAEYVRYKPEAWEKARMAYDSLAREADCLVIEGAGSPAEVNLKRHDIVNMRVAEYASAPVLLVGDIDRGGVFASFVGTMEVLDRWERELVAGFVINRFRGDAGLLGEAIEYTERRTGKPVLGVVPYLADLGLPEEDSVEFKSGALDRTRDAEGAVEIAVVDLPHISNFNDFDPFRIEPDVKLTIVRSREDLGEPDAVIIPGSKNVIGDLKYLVEKGIAGRILQLLAKGRTKVIGICGGFQMLGREIRDPHGIESADGSILGLGILQVSTTLLESKTLVQTSALHLPSNMTVKGYEIHHGRTGAGSLPPVIRRPDGEVIGAGAPDGRVWGTYLHGVFDADEFRRWFIDGLRSGRGLAPLGRVAARYDLDGALDRLAAAVRERLPVERIYRIMGLR